jgi:hypothetical protein
MLLISLIQLLSFILALILMPVFAPRHPVTMKVFYIVFCTFLTPLFGIPLYIKIFGK